MKTVFLTNDGPTFDNFKDSIGIVDEAVTVGVEGMRIKMRVTGFISLRDVNLPFDFPYPHDTWAISGRTVAGNRPSNVPVIVLASFSPDGVLAVAVVMQREGVLSESSLDLPDMAVDEAQSALGLVFRTLRKTAPPSE